MFAFGKNWSQFLKHLDEMRIKIAEKSLQDALNVSDLSGKAFLDIGSGSGLFSLAAHRLGAEVFSFDYDHDCVSCTQYLKKTYGHLAPAWSVVQGSVLDPVFLNTLAPADILYSWGVLHHTGHMYQAFENIYPLVKKEGKLFISIYNDQGRPSRIWTKIKKTYTGSGTILKKLLLYPCFLYLWGPRFFMDFVTRAHPLITWNAYKKNRGMSAWHDVVDWVGGYPFEVAKPEDVFHFFTSRGFVLETMKTCGGKLGCNEFVFLKQ